MGKIGKSKIGKYKMDKYKQLIVLERVANSAM